MQFAKGGHASGVTAPHFIGRGSTWYTELDEVTLSMELLQKQALEESDILTCEVPAGTAIIFPGTTPHRSLNSASPGIRWSADFRLHNRSAARPGKTKLDWFYGLKDSLLLRDEHGNQAFTRTERDQWAGVDRTKVQDENAGVHKEVSVESTFVPQFDPVIVGPWMDLWDIDQHENERSTNPHIDRYIQTFKTEGSAEALVQCYRDKQNW
jgi:hypothetical protein